MAIEKRCLIRLPHMQFMVTLWRRVMTPFQAARISVTAYPIIQVDMLAVVKCVYYIPGGCCPVTCHSDHVYPAHMLASSASTLSTILRHRALVLHTSRGLDPGTHGHSADHGLTLQPHLSPAPDPHLRMLRIAAHWPRSAVKRR